MDKSVKPVRIRRDLADRLRALRDHVRLLDDFITKAKQGDDAYLGEVAAKLRVLVHEGGRNRPLLLGIMDELDIDFTLNRDLPQIGDSAPNQPMRFREFLASQAFSQRVPSGALVHVTVSELIAKWAQQHGAAHEDPEIEEVLAFTLGKMGGPQFYLHGRRAIVTTLIEVACWIFSAGRDTLAICDDRFGILDSPKIGSSGPLPAALMVMAAGDGTPSGRAGEAGAFDPVEGPLL